jgi:hypothetical protein
MRLIPKHRQRSRAKFPRIAITEEEILADLLYPASRSPRRNDVALRRGGAR